MGNHITKEACFGKDWDELLSYNTPKIVRVRDRRLGIPYYLAMATIFIYVCYQVIANQRYLEKESPGGGSIRTTLEIPDINTPDYEPVPMGNKLVKWLYWNPVQTVYPAGQDGCLFITTRVTVRNTVFSNDKSSLDECNPSAPTSRKCRIKTSSTSEVYYVADIEDMTIMVEHTIRGNLLHITNVNKNLYGELLNKDDNVVWRFYPQEYKKYDKSTNYTIRESHIPGDIFSVGTLLKAVDVSLDDINNGDEPYRYSGCVIVVIIEYNNDKDEIQYKYKPSLITNAEMKILELVANSNHVSSKLFSKLSIDNTINDSLGRYEFNRHGIEIKFVQLGEIGQFEFIALCMSLVASIAMLSIASKVVESLMLYVLPEKLYYRSTKFEVSDDFSDIREKRCKNTNDN